MQTDPLLWWGVFLVSSFLCIAFGDMQKAETYFTFESFFSNVMFIVAVISFFLTLWFSGIEIYQWVVSVAKKIINPF